jgi:hypothetical protein
LVTSSTNLSNIELTGVSINGYGIRALGDIIRRTNTVRTLRIEWNNLSEYAEQFDYLCDSIRKVSSIIYVKF